MNQPLALIIEDDRDIVTLFGHVANQAGYQTDIALHGKVAVERLTILDPIPDIILLDLGLPGVPGSEILHLIRSSERLKSIPVVVITGYPYVARSLEDQPELVLLKPVNIEQLTNLLHRFRPIEKFTEESPVDESTGFLNRRFFVSLMDYALARSKQIALNHFSVLLLDLSRFKKIESQLGGDFNHNMANILRKVLRPTDTIARFDDAQFAILIEDVTNWDIPIFIANRILDRMQKYATEQVVDCQSHIGIILCDAGYFGVNEIIKDLKVALSLARAEGHTGYKFYARDEFNNAYDIDLISSIQGNYVMGQTPKRNRGLVIKNIQAPNLSMSTGSG